MEWLKKRRLELGLKQEELAAQCGISQNHYSNIETGIRKPSVDVAKKIGEVLGVEWTRFY